MTFDPKNTLHFGQGFFLPNGGPRAFLKQFDLWMTFDLWWGRFEKYALKPRGPVPYLHAKFQLDSSKHDETHIHTYWHTDLDIFSSIMQLVLGLSQVVIASLNTTTRF